MRWGALLVMGLAALALACGGDEGAGKKKVGGAGGETGQGGDGGSAGAGGSGGSGGSGGAGGTGGDEAPETIEVKGRIVRADGTPLFGARVFVNDPIFEGGGIVTEPNGSFSAKEVEVPYSLSVLNGEKVLHLEGLTNPEPLVVGEGDHRTQKFVRLRGALDEPPIPANYQLDCAVAELHACAASIDHQAGTYAVDVDLAEAAEKGDVGFVVVRNPTADSTAFVAAASLSEVDFQTSDEQDGLDLTLTPVTETFKSTVSVKPGAFTHDVEVSFHRFTLDGRTFNVSNRPVPLDKEFDVPSEGAVLEVRGIAEPGTTVFHFVPAEEGELEVELPASPMMILVRPEPWESVTASPSVQWTKVEGARSYILFFQNEGGIFFTATLPGDRSSFRLPDLRDFGVPHLGEHTVTVYALPDESDFDPEDYARGGPGLFRMKAMGEGTSFAITVPFTITD